MARQLRFYKGMFVEFSAGGGFRHSDFETRRTKAIEPTGPSQQQNNNCGSSGQGGLYGRPFGLPTIARQVLGEV